MTCLMMLVEKVNTMSVTQIWNPDSIIECWHSVESCGLDCSNIFELVVVNGLHVPGTKYHEKNKFKNIFSNTRLSELFRLVSVTQCRYQGGQVQVKLRTKFTKINKSLPLNGRFWHEQVWACLLTFLFYSALHWQCSGNTKCHIGADAAQGCQNWTAALLARAISLVML